MYIYNDEDVCVFVLSVTSGILHRRIIDQLIDYWVTGLLGYRVTGLTGYWVGN